MELENMSQVATTIKNETRKGANTAPRVGGLLEAIVARIIELFNMDVQPAKLPEGIITTPKLANGAVTADKIADRTIGASKIAADSITSNVIKNHSIATIDIADGAITTALLASNSVTAEKLATYDYTAMPHWADTLLLFKNGNIYKLKIDQIAKGMGDQTVEGRVLASKTINNIHLNDSCVNTRTIENGSVTPEKISSFFTDVARTDLDSIKTKEHVNKIYNITAQLNETTTVSAGKMIVFSDNLGHVVTQVVFGHATIESPPSSTAHGDQLTIMWRSYNPTSYIRHNIAAHSWGEWHELFTDFQNVLAPAFEYYSEKIESIEQRLNALEN